MSADRGRVLVADDSRINRQLLQRALVDQGLDVTLAEDGQQALTTLCADGRAGFDVVLLDVLMPNLDGYQTLAAIKRDTALQHIPVIMITAVDELESAIQCIELGATDYLPKPFNPALLRARVGACLSSKRFRDLELEYLEQVSIVTASAAALESSTFSPSLLDDVAQRPDALGNLARVFRRMAAEVIARENRLQRQMHELQIEIDEVQRSRRLKEITGTAYFSNLREQATDLRRIVQSQEE